MKRSNSQDEERRPPPLKPQLSAIFNAIDEPQPSPPYHAFASSSRLQLPPQDSPAYRSSDGFDMPGDEKERVMADGDERDEKRESMRLQVHYPDELGNGPAPSYKALAAQRTDSSGMISSRASSIGSDDGEDSEEYDWSDEDDLVDEEAKFEQKMGLRKKPSWGLKRVLTFLFSTLVGSMFLTGILVAGPLLVHFFWYVPHKSERRRYVLDNIESWLFWAAANLLISWFLALIIDVVPAIVRAFISFSWGHVSEAVKSRIELYNSVKDTVKPVFYAASGWVSWIIIFAHIYKLYDSDHPSKSRASYTDRVYEVVEFLFFFALVISAARMLSHFIAFAFHRTAFKDRLDTLSETLKVIEVLRNYRPTRTHQSRGSRHGFGLFTPMFAADGKEKAGYFAGSTLTDDEDGSKKGKHRSSPHTYPPSGQNTPTRRSVEESDEVVTKAAKALKNAVLHDARNIKGKSTEKAGLVWDVTNAHEAKRLARAIYGAFRAPGRKYLLPSDFKAAFASAAEAEAAFRVFDKDNNGDISRAEIKTVLVKVYKERRFLSRSMRDVGQALHTLDQIILFFAFVVLFFISLSVFGVNIANSLTSVYTLGIGLSFVFKNSASNAFDAVMFLFVTHPFDTGDRCFIDDENLVVKKMGLFATVFTRVDGSETYYFNSLLFTKFITNLRRSGTTFENATLQVAWDTPMERLDALEREMNEWLATEENRWFVPNTGVTLQQIVNQRYLEVTVGIGHNGTWQDWGLRTQRKTTFHAALQHYCRQLGIVCYDSTRPIVWADAEAGTYVPPAESASSPGRVPSSPGLAPPSPGVAPSSNGGDGEFEMTRAFDKPVLGFMPPQDERGGVKVRKSTRKAAKRQLGASMADA